MSANAIDPDRAAAGRRLAGEKLAARRARLRRIRLSVVAAALTAFVAVWALIFVTLASGNDPTLAKTGQTAHKATATTAVVQPAATTSGSSSASTPTPVQTGQS